MPPPGGGGPPPPDGYWPPAPGEPKPFYKRAWFIVPAVLVCLGGIGNALDDDRSPADDSLADAGTALPAVNDDAAPAPDREAEPEAPPARMGEPAADGDFRFVVDRVDCGATQLGSERYGATAQGQFCIVDLTITNIGNEGQTFWGENIVLLNAQGQEFSSDTTAAFHLDNSSSFYEEVNPGNTLHSRVVFDVPTGMTPTAIELHDSAFSGGVTVLLQ